MRPAGVAKALEYPNEAGILLAILSRTQWTTGIPVVESSAVDDRWLKGLKGGIFLSFVTLAHTLLDIFSHIVFSEAHNDGFTHGF
jgi:hypothetical protein